MKREDIRNIAIIAHVDHGKTTLVDGMLRQSGIFRENEQVVERVLDSNDLERERGITILAKNTSVPYNGLKINIVDTPGHADFGGEVERILSMVDGALLVVDAFEGPMPQTKFVLRKALQADLKPVVVINKIDRPDARPAEVVDEVLDLFIELGADDDQLEFPVVYASARDALAKTSLDDDSGNLKPLFETIVKAIPAPEGDPEGVLQLMVTTLDYDTYVGRIVIGRIQQGKIRSGEWVGLAHRDGAVEKVKVGQVYIYHGLKRVTVDEADVGEIVAVSGLENANLGETVTSFENPQPLPVLTVDEPTLTMTFSTNDSPFAGQEGEYVTSRHLRDRLMKELEKNVSLRVEETDSPDVFQVSGRGELHLSILIETIRREGYELAVSKPRVIMKEIDGELCEPLEMLTVDIPEEFLGVVMERLGARKAEMADMSNSGTGHLRLEFIIPARGLIGFRSDFLTETKGYGIMNHIFHGYGPYRGEIPGRTRGSVIATETGEATTYAIHNLQERATMFIGPGIRVYAGMVVGENSRERDMEANVCKKKHMSNVRSSTAEETLRLTTPRILSLEEALEQIADDELVEVTPRSIRLRKAVLDSSRRDRARKKKDKAEQAEL
ncbi:MAG: translational GTPase TypA [Actinobacteria bacterium]|nr:translational GTPase TypA [Actinomycetota bacterium]